MVKGSFGYSAQSMQASEADSSAAISPVAATLDPTPQSASQSPSLYLSGEYGASPNEYMISALVLDAAIQSVQTGTISLHSLLRCNSSGYSSRSHPVSFVSPFRASSRPEVFVTLSRFQPSDSAPHPVTQLVVAPRQVDEKGFRMMVACAADKGEPNREVAEMWASITISWLAFDPRMNRSWVHGEIWLPEHRKSVFMQVSFDAHAHSSTGTVGVPRVAFTEPPIVFFAIGGLVTSAPGLSVVIDIPSIDTDGFGLLLRARHAAAATTTSAGGVAGGVTDSNPSVTVDPGVDADGDVPPPSDPSLSRDSSSAVSRSRPLTRICIRWIALPANVARAIQAKQIVKAEKVEKAKAKPTKDKARPKSSTYRSGEPAKSAQPVSESAQPHTLAPTGDHRPSAEHESDAHTDE